MMLIFFSQILYMTQIKPRNSLTGSLQCYLSYTFKTLRINLQHIAHLPIPCVITVNNVDMDMMKPDCDSSKHYHVTASPHLTSPCFLSVTCHLTLNCIDGVKSYRLHKQGQVCSGCFRIYLQSLTAQTSVTFPFSIYAVHIYCMWTTNCHCSCESQGTHKVVVTEFLAV